MPVGYSRELGYREVDGFWARIVPVPGFVARLLQGVNVRLAALHGKDGGDVLCPCC